MSRPYWWETLLLLAAAYRLWRLLAFDTITDRPRTWVLRKLGEKDTQAYFVTCPFCSGLWVTGLVLAAYCGVYGWIGWFSFGVHWLAMSLGVGLLGSKVDT